MCLHTATLTRTRAIHMCPHTAMYVSPCRCICVLILPCICRHTGIYVSSYCYICVPIPLHMCPHTAMYMCPHSTVYAARGPCDPFEVLLHMCPHTAMYICLHTTICVSSYCYIYVSAGASLRLGKTIKRQNAHPRGVYSTTVLVSALFLILEKKNLGFRGANAQNTLFFLFC